MTPSPLMNSHLDSREFGGLLLPTVIAIIVASIAALAWEWRRAHTAAMTHEPAMAQDYSLKKREMGMAADSRPPGETDPSNPASQ